MIGTAHAMQPQDIVVRGAGLQDQHAYIINHDDVVTLYPLSELTSVDSIRINKPTRLSQGRSALRYVIGQLCVLLLQTSCNHYESYG